MKLTLNQHFNLILKSVSVDQQICWFLLCSSYNIIYFYSHRPQHSIVVLISIPTAAAQFPAVFAMITGSPRAISNPHPHPHPTPRWSTS